jgi:hypothetical protein
LLGERIRNLSGLFVLETKLIEVHHIVACREIIGRCEYLLVSNAAPALNIKVNHAILDLTAKILQAECATPLQVVEYLAAEFFSVELAVATKARLATQLAMDLGTDDIAVTATYLEEPLRKLLHQMLSLPEYQLG